MKKGEINWISVSSSNVHQVAHHASVLYVAFRNGSVYSYANVTEELFRQLLEGASFGRMLHQLIKLKEVDYPATRLA